IGSEAMKFYLFTAAGLGINVAVATIVKEIGPETRLWAGIAAPALATAISMIWNFSAYRFVVFRPSPSSFVPSPKP
ncbi:MAG: GtrA family protein, partial [Candidatus Terrybacteria bacterium]|nr:GtrA family protein [Candidatus Terrybacteria bacterium]